MFIFLKCYFLFWNLFVNKLLYTGRGQFLLSNSDKEVILMPDLSMITDLLAGFTDFIPAELLVLFEDLFAALMDFFFGLLDYFMSFLG